ncbi:MAG: tetratricopeptide repeat protein, partial [Betaproteobacteria bacterium]|nr:tetratricopeptide repeat protein [Betaproteobacteria bacterium]
MRHGGGFPGRFAAVLAAAGLLAGCGVYDWQLKDDRGWQKPDTDATVAELGIERAIYHAETELLIAAQHLGMHDRQIAASLEELARLHVDSGNHAAAAHLRARAQQLGGAVPVPESAATVSYTGRYRSERTDAALAEHYTRAGAAVNRVARSYLNADHAVAESLHLRAIAIVEGGLGRQHLALVPTLRDYARVKAAGRDLTSARALLERSLAIIEYNRSGNDVLLLASLDQLAAVHLQAQDFTAAEAVYRRALAIRRLHAADDDGQTAVNLANLALALTRLGRPEEAAGLLEESVSLDQ